MSAVLAVEGVGKSFVLPRRSPWGRRETVVAVSGVDLELQRGRTLGVVGESGSGKTTLGRMIVGLERPTEGRILVDGVDLVHADRATLRRMRPRVQMVFQDSHSSLDPRLVVAETIAEPILANGILPRADVATRVAELARRCGLGEDSLRRYPHELSGGQRQRVSIARALASSPELVVLDEPTSALDVSVQAQVLNLLKDLQDEFSLTYVFVSHDLAVVRAMSDELLVLSGGSPVESGPADAIFREPAHPYTRRLLDAVPRVDATPEERP